MLGFQKVKTTSHSGVRAARVSSWLVGTEGLNLSSLHPSLSQGLLVFLPRLVIC